MFLKNSSSISRCVSEYIYAGDASECVPTWKPNEQFSLMDSNGKAKYKCKQIVLNL